MPTVRSRFRRLPLAVLVLTACLGAATLAGPAPAADALALPESARPVHREMLQRLLDSNAANDFQVRSDGSMAICWTEGSDPDVASTFDETLERKGLSLFQFSDGNHWSNTATDGGGLGQGDPTTLTWSFAPDGTAIAGFAGEPSGASNLIAFLDGIYGSGPGGADLTQRPWFTYFEQVFSAWGDFIGVDYVYEPADDGAAHAYSGGILGVRGDIRIGGHTIDGNSNILAYNFFPNTGDMVIDTADNFYSNTGGNSLGLRNVLTHEHGHGLGIDHVCPINQTKLMEPFVSFAFDGVQYDDEHASNRGYGDTDEFPTENDSYTAATAFGAVSVPGTVIRDRSIDDNSDTDYFAFTVPANTEISVTVAPRGSNYLQGPQNANGSCTPGTLTNPTDDQNLQLQVYGTAGTNLLASANATGAGSSETIANLALTDGAGTYYVRVLGGGSNAAQLYNLDLTLAEVTVNEPPTAICQDVTSCDGNVVAADVDNGSNDPEGSLTLTLEPAGPYPPGDTVVDLIASDGSLADTCSATVSVNQAPTAVCRDFVTSGFGDGCTVAVPADSLNDGSSDPDGNLASFLVEPAGPYGAGVTPVSFIVTDSCGVADTCAANVTVTCFTGPELGVDPAAVAFNGVAVGDTTCQVVTVRNTGDLAMTIDSVTGCDSGDFWLDLAALVTPVAPGDSTSFELCYAPTAGGADSCEVTVATPDSSAVVSVTSTSTVLSTPGGPGGSGSMILAALSPNPFRSSTGIRFELPVSAHAVVEVFDVQGRKVRDVVDNELLDAGAHTAQWDGRNEQGTRVAAGIYFVRLTALRDSRVVRAVLLP